MEIFGHIIATTEIIGISPLYRQPAKDLTMSQMYGAHHLVFKVYCKQRDVEIESDLFAEQDAYKDDKKELHKRRVEDFKTEYNKIRDKIKLLTKS